MRRAAVVAAGLVARAVLAALGQPRQAWLAKSSPLQPQKTRTPDTGGLFIRLYKPGEVVMARRIGRIWLRRGADQDSGTPGPRGASSSYPLLVFPAPLETPADSRRAKRGAG
jgi:hypothetical protein